MTRSLTHESAAKEPDDEADPAHAKRANGIGRLRGDFRARSARKATQLKTAQRADQAGVTAYLLYNGSATYVL